MMLDEFETSAGGIEHGDDGNTVSMKQIRRVVTKMSHELLLLSQLQVSAITSLATVRDSRVEITEFLAEAVPLIQKLVELSPQKTRADAIDTMAWADGVADLYGLTDAEVEAQLQPEFAAACEPHDEFKEYQYLHLHHAFTSLVEPLGIGKIALPGGKKDRLMSGIDENADGVIELPELGRFLSDVVKQLEREQYVNDLATQELRAQEEAADDDEDNDLLECGLGPDIDNLGLDSDSFQVGGTRDISDLRARSVQLSCRV
jgi:hypothetical protein